jgi:biotin-[acetyl-CoA-carboxylase] ligase BirA-like protein
MHDSNFRFICFDEIDSTQKYAIRNIDTLPNMVAIIANRQSSGIGKPGSIWESPEGNLFVTYVISDYDFLSNTQIIQAATVAVIQTLNIVNIHGCEIKWLNDILLGGKKIGGVRCDRVSNKNEYARLVIGLGLNLNVAPDVVTGSSVLQQTGIMLDPTIIARIYGVHLMRMIVNLTHNHTNLVNKYQENVMTKNIVNEEFNKFLAYKNEVVEMAIENTRFFGKIKYAHPNGTLEVETKNGPEFYRECKIVLTNSY